MTEEQLSRLERLAEASWKTINWDGPDAELIAAMRNALPELLKEIRERRTIDQAVITTSWGEECRRPRMANNRADQAEAERDRLREALAKICDSPVSAEVLRIASRVLEVANPGEKAMTPSPLKRVEES